MTKIKPEHLVRNAIVYVRQSTTFQVTQNLESQRRQYGLTERARQLGWSDVEVIDDDLGRSGAGARRFMSRGAVRSGEALLPGIFRCARCGKKLHVRYGQTYRYECVGAFNQLAAARCITFGGMRVDRVIAKEVLDRLQPLGVEAALAVIEARNQRRTEKKRQLLDLALQQARYEAARAQRQYDAADPENRLVAGELEHRWNERLVAVRDLELEIDRLDADKAPTLTEMDRERLMALGQDLMQAWENPGATPETRKKIIRTVISEIIVDIVGDTLELIIHWQGGDHTRLMVKRNRAGQTRWTTDAEVVDVVRALARQMPDETIASVLNRSGKSTGFGNSWTRGRICSLRRQYHIAIYRDGERADRGEVTLNEAATALALSTTTIRRLIAEGALPASQHCKGAPWVIRLADLERDEIRAQSNARRSRRPPPDERQKNLLDLSMT